MNREPLAVLDLGQDGTRYVRGSTDVMSSTLGQHLRRLPLETGRVWTRLPVSIPRSEAVARLEYGGLAATGRRAGWPNHLIATYLGASRARYAVAPAPWDPSWPVVASLEIPYFLYLDEVHLFLAGGGCLSDPVISELEDDANVYPYVATLTSLPEGYPPLEHRTAVQSETLALLAQRTEYLIVGAYDGETDVVWERPEADRPTLQQSHLPGMS